MRKKQYFYFAGAIRSRLDADKRRIEVERCGLGELYTQKEREFESLKDLWKYMAEYAKEQNLCVYFHDLKLTGPMWIEFFIRETKLKQAITSDGFIKDAEMPASSFKYTISAHGEWFRILIRINRHWIEIRDSKKLLPFKWTDLAGGLPGVKKEGDSLKAEIDVLRASLEVMFDGGHDQATIGACCLTEFKKSLADFDIKEIWNWYFPDLYQIPLDSEIYGARNAGEYCRNAYRGGWNYLVPEKAGKLIKNGFTLDANSMYASQMHSESGNVYPIGKPIFWRGNKIPDHAKRDDIYYFVRFKIKFELKDGCLPFIQVKDSIFYSPIEHLKTSRIRSIKDGKLYDYYLDEDGNRQEAAITMTMTQVDFELIKKFYKIQYLEILDGCFFKTSGNLFDDYISKWRAIKENSDGVQKQIAKLFLVNLTGKFAAKPNDAFKRADLRNGRIVYSTSLKGEKNPGYIPVGAAITAYGRRETILAAQANYFGPDKPGFTYSDTDSIHSDQDESTIKGVKMNAKKFLCWKIEKRWDEAIFVKQKAYIERDNETKEHSIKCAGMPERCRQVLRKSLGENVPELPDSELDAEELEFVSKKRTTADFRSGLMVPGNRIKVEVAGGVGVVKCFYELR